MINRAGLAWLLLGLIWGTNFVFIKWSTETVTPMQVALVRVIAGFLTVAAYALVTRQLKLSHLRHSVHFVVMACLAAALYFYGFAEGTALLESGLAGAVSASIPLFSLLAAVLFLPEEKLTTNRVLGLLVGLVGVTLIAKPFSGGLGDSYVLGVLWMILGSFSLGVSFVYARRFVTPLDLPPAALTTYQLGFASLILLAVTDKSGLGALYDDPTSFAVLVFGLGILGTGLAYVLYYYVIGKLGAVRASALTYVPPVVALFLGALFLGEGIVVLDYLATSLIFAGVILVNKRPKSQS
ncbi:DMT family transporter [Roseovarius aestuarii]|uniref:Putative inner membrane transporter YedA n=2 Tax=Roseovarius aestuarii TaxID=475083 RepID=A0A1X7BZQ3_9RHOB|nr:DMT family transporter [Roseovarius aestuarii]SMC14749.1 putative inner membrane transporter YedA [Roseovarius aestuarii]